MNFKRLRWLFPIAVTLHNAEEAIWMPPWVSEHATLFPVPGAARIRIALVVVTGAAFAVTCLSARKGPKSIWTYLLFGSVVAMLANVFVPHVPATLYFRSYTPGVVTAVLINLPVMSYLATQAVRERWVSAWKAALFAAAVPLALAGMIYALFIGWIIV